jgi:hypothetical protein
MYKYCAYFDHIEKEEDDELWDKAFRKVGSVYQNSKATGTFLSFTDDFTKGRVLLDDIQRAGAHSKRLLAESQRPEVVAVVHEQAFEQKVFQSYIEDIEEAEQAELQ